MSVERKYSSVSHPDQMQQLGEIARACFGNSLSDWKWYRNLLGDENFRILQQAEKVSAGLAFYRMGQWFGGQIVPMTGIAAVGVAPEARGKGVAYQLMSEAVEELHRQKIAISALYPATQALYRKVGYGQAGYYCKWELPTASIQLQERQLEIEQVELNKYQFETIYQQQAQLNNGNLVRYPAIWQRILEPPQPETIYAYTVGSDAPEGYIIFKPNRQPEKATIEIKDWAWLNGLAAQRLWTFIGDHRSQIEQVTWFGSPLNPSTLLLPEQTAKMVWQMIWMLRIVDLPAALTTRGYPMGLEAELHLKVQDDLLEANNGHFCLKVSQGKGEISRGGKGNFQIDIRPLASLYTGFLTPQQLQQLGKLKTSPEALAIASLIFSGSCPWMADFF